MRELLALAAGFALAAVLRGAAETQSAKPGETARVRVRFASEGESWYPVYVVQNAARYFSKGPISVYNPHDQPDIDKRFVEFEVEGELL